MTLEPAERAGRDPAPALEMRRVKLRFGSTPALAGVDLRVERGEVHALIGHNGAGKSTLMKVLSGVHAPDAGEVLLDGRPFAPAGPAAAREAGVSMIYQELSLAPHLSVEANVSLGMEDHRWGFVRRRRHVALVREALATLGRPGIDPLVPAGSLSPGEQQIVEIARALVRRPRIVILDEPTSSLSRDDAARLFEVIGRLRSGGVSVIFISHALEEVYRVADRFTVLRNGETAGSGEVAAVTPRRIIELMVGRPIGDLFPRVPHERGEPVLSLSDLRGRSLPRGVSLELHRGEVLGIAGLVGAGRTETLRAIYGLEPVREGRIAVKGRASGRSTPPERLREGIGYLSEDRKEEGLALDRSVTENLTLSRLEPLSRAGCISRSREREAVIRWISELGIRCRGPHQAVRELSGGNQQKVALARLLHQDAEILLLDEPTRGIDVESKVEIYRLVGELAAAGKSIIFVSSYIPELIGVADRIAVMARGRIRAIRDSASWTEHDVLLAATGPEEAA